ncbi:MaoC family dehydratase [Phytohabitans houttuyneae]|uniref:Putative enoyl-CoA hydratase 1 n=1 Tax=Phytohabitans houttuyneae TaxID=1076126 RepID=A0A6V8KI91_9ACTN|nr:MaoC family dehydratase [Phytohabitans houttuyneae]GFJ81427.1 putative enoyl-CoA hydratase 1 [Phytohabitans houttuyneae]
MRIFPSPDHLSPFVGQTLGTSAWHQVTQARVDRFAEVTADHQWIHVDPARAAQGPFRTTIAHGFLIASMLPALLAEVVCVKGCELALNRRVDNVRFDTPVPVGSHIRARFVLADSRARPRGFWQAVYDAYLDIEDGAEAACSARLTWLYGQAPASAGA